MHAAISSQACTAFRSPRHAVIIRPFHVGLGIRGVLPDEAPEPGQPEAARRYRVLERACATAPVYPADQDPGRDTLAGPGLPKLRRAAK